MTALRATVAGIALTAVGGCLYLLLAAGESLYATLGPTRMAVGADGTLQVVSHGRLHEFGADGTRRASIDLAALGVSRRPSELARHADGRVVFADPDTSTLSRCTLPSGPCERLDPGLSAAEQQSLLPLNSVRIAVDDAAQRYYISDNAGHRVVIADFSGRALAASQPGAFRYPNALAVTAPGELTVADTNHHRIVTYDVRGDRFGAVLREIATRVGASARQGRSWVFDAQAVPGGETWALVADGRMRNADVRVFDAAGRAIRRVDLGTESDPFAIRAWNSAVLVADATSYRIVNAAASGAPTALRDAEFARELDSERERVNDWRRWRLAAQAGLVAIPLAAILVLWMLREPLPVRAAAASPGPAHGVTWVGLDPDFVARTRRQIRTAAWVVVALHVAIAAVLSPAFFTGKVAMLVEMGLWLAASLLFFYFIFRSVSRGLGKERLGASATHLHVDAPGTVGGARAGTREVKWDDVYFDGRKLLAGPDFVVVSSPQTGWRFPQAEFMREIAARIPSRNHVGAGALVWRSVLKGSPLGLMIVLGTAAALVYLGWELATLL
jgi:sugar lactone lactonase YvrE